MHLRNLLYPRGSWRDMLLSLCMGAGGAVVAGIYGSLHDQITYSISPEYFTRMKFIQFQRYGTGLPARWFVAEIGFLATWWVGLISMWFLARLVFRWHPRERVLRICMKGCAIMLGTAITCGLIGYGSGPLIYQGADWEEILDTLGVRNGQAFSHVAGIHLGSYAGGLLGWIAAMVWTWRRRARNP